MPKRQPVRRQTAHSNTYRFFIHPEMIVGDRVRIEDAELAHQLGTVLRLAPGSKVLLLDNTGWQYTTLIEQIERGLVTGTIEHRQPAAGEPRTTLTLYLALMRAEKFEWALQKGTELGVTTFVPFLSERSLVSDANETSERKAVRWSKIIREAAEQSRRGIIPRLTLPQRFPEACQQASVQGTALLLWEGSGAQPLRVALAALRENSVESTGPQSIAVFSGPEGGFATAELETARDYGIIPVTLGPRTLRAETAPLVAATAIFYELGDLD